MRKEIILGFPAVNTPDAMSSPVTPHSRFPTVRPLYNRNQDPLTGQLLDNLGNLAARSVDPYPDGRIFVGKGIKPDIEVTHTVKDYLQQKDPVLERAINLLQQKIK